MAIIKIRQLGTLGVVKDVLPTDLPPEAWTDSKNCQFTSGYVARARGQQRVGPTEVYPVEPWYLLSNPTSPGFNELGLPFVVFSDMLEVHAFGNNFGYENLTPDGGIPGAQTADGIRTAWPSGGWFNGVLVYNARSRAGPWYLNGPPQAGGRLELLPNFSIAGVSELHVSVLRPYRNFLLGLGVWEQNQNFATHLLWSHPADPGTVPPSWDVTDPTTMAGRVPLGATAAPLIDCLQLGDMNIVYKLDSVIRMERIASNAIFSFREISNQAGMLAQDCAVNFTQGRQLFLTNQGDVAVTDGHSVQSLLDGKHQRYLPTRIKWRIAGQSFVVADRKNREVYVCYPSVDNEGTLFCDEALIWNWVENTWAIRKLPLCLAGLSAPVAAEFEDDQRMGRYTSMIGFPDNNEIREIGVGVLDSGAVFECELERRGLAIVGQDIRGNISHDPTVMKQVTKLWPLISAPAGELVPFTVSVGVHDTMDGEITWQDFPFVANQDSFIEPLLTGRFLAIKFRSAAGVDWKLHGYDVELNVVGAA